MEHKRCLFLYQDADGAVFMDNENYEQFTLPLDQVEGTLPYLKDNTEVHVTFYESKPIGVQPPIKVALQVKETTPGVKGDTATGGTKQATMETGVVVNVPLFVQEGEELLINTETGEYVSRA